MTDVLDDDEGRMFSFDDEPELDEYVESYLREGWTCPHGVKPNTRFRGAEGE